MDKEFIGKLNSISEWETIDSNSEQSAFSISFSNEEVGLVRISSDRGEFIYKLKQLDKLFMPDSNDTADINTEDPRNLSLLHTIESAIKRTYENDPALSDSSVILAMEKLSLKPEIVSDDIIVRAINRELRLKLSMSDYSRNQVKRAIRKILKSAKRHKQIGGLRGYLDFIMEYVP